jgi:hypothetical protein
MRNLLATYRVTVDETEVFRTMGYPGPDRVSEPVRDLCLEHLRRFDDFVEPWAGAQQVRIDAVDVDGLSLEGGRRLKSQRLSTLMRRATSVRICLATVGARISAEVERLIAAGSMLEAWALDAAASVAVKALMIELRRRVCTEAGADNCSTTLRYGPGYTGWRLEDIPVLFAYIGEEGSPVRLNGQAMMTPAKSLLNVIGLVPGGHSATREVVPCRICDLEPCSIRQVPYHPAHDPAAPGERNNKSEA